MKEKPLSQSIKEFFIGVGEGIKRELSDPGTLGVFLIVCAVVSSEVGVLYIIGFFTGNEGFFATATTLWGIGGLPGIEFIPLCLAITVGIKAIINKCRGKKDE